MAVILSQQTVDSKSFLNPRNGWIVPDVLGIINLMVSTPQKTVETGIIKFSQNVSSYEEKILEFFYIKEYRSEMIRRCLDGKNPTYKPIDKSNCPISILKVFYKTGTIQCIGPDFNKCKEFLIKNIFTDLEITKSKITLTNYSYDFGTNIDFARFHPKLDPKLEATLSQRPWKILIKYSGITYIIFQSGKMVISCHNTILSISVLNYLNHLVSCYQTLERPLTF